MHLNDEVNQSRFPQPKTTAPMKKQLNLLLCVLSLITGIVVTFLSYRNLTHNYGNLQKNQVNMANANRLHDTALALIKESATTQIVEEYNKIVTERCKTIKLDEEIRSLGFTLMVTGYASLLSGIALSYVFWRIWKKGHT